ncbi:hypothetical protein FBU30_004989 [Linnemannia zychae]|nr:hypothetical protein FBU30_004989 [Linnemannia zychae]
MANRNGYTPVSSEQEHGYDDPSSQPPPYSLSEEPSSPYFAPHGGSQYTASPSAPPVPSSTAPPATLLASPQLYPQLYQQQEPQSSAPSSHSSPHQYHSYQHQYLQQQQPKSPYQAIPTQNNPYQHQQYQQPQSQTPHAQRSTQNHAGHFGPAPVASSPLVLARPPTRIEDLKTRPAVVICPCCHHLVLTETSTENGMFGILFCGITKM